MDQQPSKQALAAALAEVLAAAAAAPADSAPMTREEKFAKVEISTMVKAMSEGIRPFKMLVVEAEHPELYDGPITSPEAIQLGWASGDAWTTLDGRRITEADAPALIREGYDAVVGFAEQAEPAGQVQILATHLKRYLKAKADGRVERRTVN